MEDYIFVILRHVRSDYFNLHWIRSYESIRKYYKNKILIIDNNSDYNYINYPIPLINTEIIKASHPETRLFSPYNELLKRDDYNKAIIIHDSVFFVKYIDFNKYQNNFFWTIKTHLYDFYEREQSMLDLLTNNKELKQIHTERKWNGCFGCCMIIEKELLDRFEKKYKISNLSACINSQQMAISFERILGVLCYAEDTNIQIPIEHIFDCNPTLLEYDFDRDKTYIGRVIKLNGSRK